jgi:TPR repeat protein
LAGKNQVPTCHCCNGETKKFGRFQNKNRIVQRYRCLRCAKTFSESQPLDGLRVDFKQACHVVHLLCECSLGEHYLTGLGCETNRTQAVYWLTQAANQGDLEASNKLAEIQDLH